MIDVKEVSVCSSCGCHFDLDTRHGSRHCPCCGAERHQTPVPAGVKYPASKAGEHWPKGNKPEDVTKATTPDDKTDSYELIGELGKGLMGVVHRARQETTGRIVALKQLCFSVMLRPTEAARLEQEAAMAAQLDHPNIVKIHMFSSHKGKPCSITDYVSGMPLDRMLKSGRLSIKEACRLLESLARALEFAHGKNVVHGDLKPTNIIITSSGQPRITDFGFAFPVKLALSSGQLDFGSAAEDSLPYMPPESFDSRVRNIDARGDVYSLGAILYECVTGRKPFTGASASAILPLVIRQAPTPPGRLRTHLPREVERMILKCLEKNPKRRYQSAAELAADCRMFLEGRRTMFRSVAKLRRWVGLICQKTVRLFRAEERVKGLS